MQRRWPGRLFTLLTLVAAADASELGALTALYHASGGATWLSNAGWLSGNPCNGATSTWHGVTCDSTGSVSALDLQSKSLSGGIPSQLAALTQLSALKLRGWRLGMNACSLFVSNAALEVYHMDKRSFRLV